jgi:hypothetical protein
MARKITMFELHFDGAHIGPTFGDSTEEPDAVVDEVTTAVESADAAGADVTDVTESVDAESGGSEWARRVVGLAVVVGAVAAGRAAVRRVRSTDDVEEEIVVEADDEELTDEPTTP